MNHAVRGWIGIGLLVGLFWEGRATAQECEPDGGTGCKDDSLCIPYTCNAPPENRGYCESSIGLCPPGSKDGTPCGSGMTCRSHHEILSVESLDGSGFACEALISYCSLAPADSGDGGIDATSGSDAIGAAGVASSAAAGGSASVSALIPPASPSSTNALGAGGASTAETTSSGGRSSEAEEPKDAGLGASSDSRSDGSSCSVANGRSGRFPAFGATAALLFVVSRRRRRAGAPPRSYA